MTGPLLRQTLEDAVVRMFVATDERDWDSLQACFTDPFTLDMTSLAGGTPVELTPRQVAEAWAEGFKTLDHVHHQVGNWRIQVDGAKAQVRCYGIAFHHRGGIAAPVKTRTFVGTYELDLVDGPGGWRIRRLAFLLKFIDGNLALETAE